MASPWSAPGWMKDTDSLVQGSLLQKYEEAYAQYFVKFVRAYAKAGIPTDYVSLQNEPLYEPEDYPGMGVMPDQAARFLGRHLGPALDRAGLDDTTILGYDHNWDITDYPEAIYHDRRAARYVPGTAWHCYGGEVSAQSVSHNNYPHAQAFLTECSGGDWQGTRRRGVRPHHGLGHRRAAQLGSVGDPVEPRPRPAATVRSSAAARRAAAWSR